jgi:hypothetical protein
MKLMQYYLLMSMRTTLKEHLVLANKFQIPIYLSYGTYQMSHKKINDGYKIKFELIKNFDSFMIDDISVSPYASPS